MNTLMATPSAGSKEEDEDVVIIGAPDSVGWKDDRGKKKGQEMLLESLELDDFVRCEDNL